jgi:hypothetical protein
MCAATLSRSKSGFDSWYRYYQHCFFLTITISDGFIYTPPSMRVRGKSPVGCPASACGKPIRDRGSHCVAAAYQFDFAFRKQFGFRFGRKTAGKLAVHQTFSPTFQPTPR